MEGVKFLLEVFQKARCVFCQDGEWSSIFQLNSYYRSKDSVQGCWVLFWVPCLSCLLLQWFGQDIWGWDQICEMWRSNGPDAKTRLGNGKFLRHWVNRGILCARFTLPANWINAIQIELILRSLWLLLQWIVSECCLVIFRLFFHVLAWNTQWEPAIASSFLSHCVRTLFSSRAWTQWAPGGVVRALRSQGQRYPASCILFLGAAEFFQGFGTVLGGWGAQLDERPHLRMSPQGQESQGRGSNPPAHPQVPDVTAGTVARQTLLHTRLLPVSANNEVIRLAVVCI